MQAGRAQPARRQPGLRGRPAKQQPANSRAHPQPITPIKLQEPKGPEHMSRRFSNQPAQAPTGRRRPPLSGPPTLLGLLLMSNLFCATVQLAADLGPLRAPTAHAETPAAPHRQLSGLDAPLWLEPPADGPGRMRTAAGQRQPLLGAPNEQPAPPTAAHTGIANTSGPQLAMGPRELPQAEAISVSKANQAAPSSVGGRRALASEHQQPATSNSSSSDSGQPAKPSAHDHNANSAPNNNNNNNSTLEQDEVSLIYGIITANSIIFVIGLCGNSMVILVILRFTRIETVTDIYILNLAFADLMFILGLVFLITTMFIGDFIFGNLMCKLYMASTSLNQFASSLLLVVMSFDRFLAVCHPIYAQRFRRLRRAKVICLCIWITCLVLMTPIFAFAKTNDNLTCGIFWPDYKSFNCEIAFTLYSFAIGFAVPLLLIAAFYICVIRKLRQAASGPIGLGSSRRSRSRENTNKRVEHLVIGIICTYTICWLPYWLTQLCVSFTTLTNEPPISGFYQFVLISTSLSYTNSALNPILYAFLSDNFKRRCSEVVRSIYSIKWCQVSQCTDTHSTATTTLYYESTAAAAPQQQQQQHHHHLTPLRVSPNATEPAPGRPESNKSTTLTTEPAQTANNGKHSRLIMEGPMGNHQHCEPNQQQQQQFSPSSTPVASEAPFLGPPSEAERPTTTADDQANISLVPLVRASQAVSTSEQHIQLLDTRLDGASGSPSETGDGDGLGQASGVTSVARKKSVNFSVDTFVVQGLSVKGDERKVFQLDKKDQYHGV